MSDWSNVEPLETLRQPPQSVEAEQAVIGGLLLRNDAWPKVGGWLKPEDFYRRDHRLIFQAIGECLGRNLPADAVTLGEWLEAQGLSEQVGGMAYLVDLASTTPSAANIEAYAEIVRDKSLLRQMIEVGTEIVNDGFRPDGRDVRELAAMAQAKLLPLTDSTHRHGVRNSREVGKEWFAELNERFERGGGLIGLATPWAQLNRITGGLQAGQLAVLAARPSMGKSAVAVNLALSAAMRDKRVLFVNLEMSATSLYSRAIGALKGVPLEWFRDPQGDDGHHWAKVSDGVKDLNGKPLLFDDTPGLSLAAIVNRAKREHMRGKLDLLIVDHLHLMPLPGKTRETVEIGHITAGFKALAKQLGIPVLLLAQLNRGLEARANKRPVMADLRESGNIEQDADLILLLYRDDYYAQQEGRQSESPGMLEMIVAKQRDGKTGKVWCQFVAEHGLVLEGDEPERREDAPVTNKRRVYASGGRDRAAGAA